MIKTRENQLAVHRVTLSYAKEKEKKPNCVIISTDKKNLIDLRLFRSMMAIEPVLWKTDASSLILTSGASGRINALFSVRALKSLAMLISTLLMLLLVPFRGRKRSISSAEKPPLQDYEERKGGGRGAVVRVPAKIVPWRSPAAADHEAAVRRAIAIRRVVQDNDEKSVREFELFVSARADTMFTQSWTPPFSIKIRGLVILLHGLNEHGGRYSDFAGQLNAHGYKVYAMDWIGHGGSDGLHAYVHSLDDAVADMTSYLEKVIAENPGLPCFCFGHSTGAAIVLKAWF